MLFFVNRYFISRFFNYELGKKGKKTKGKTLALNDFLQETPGTTPTIPIRKTNINWADEVEDNYDQYESRPKANVVLPTAPKSARGFDEFSERIPQHPPYNAYITNLPYDVQEEEIAEFFGDLKIASMRIPREGLGEPSKLRGYGYVEFEDRESLIGALTITDCTLKNRRIRIEVADNSDNDRKRGGRMDNNRDRPDRSEITSGDWRSRPRVDPPEPERNRSSGFSRDRDRDNAPSDRDRGGSWRDNRERSNLKDMDRGGRDGFSDRNRFNEKDGEKRSFAPRRDRDDRDNFSRGAGSDREGFSRGAGSDREGFSRGGAGGERENFSRGAGREDSSSDRFEPRTRPKLVLQRRTIPLASDGEQEGPPQEVIEKPVPVAAASSSSIFGKAKPVDTSIRERQIEDRLAKQSEKPVSESSRENRRDTDRRDWGKRDDDVRRDRRKESPRRDSPLRRSSPDSRNDYSPTRNTDFVDRRADSPSGRYSPDRRKKSPDFGRYSPERRRRSPDYRANSPIRRRTSPDNRRSSLDRRRTSPDRRGTSPEHRRNSHDRARFSPDRGSDLPDRKPGSPIQRRRSPKSSSERRWDSSENRKDSPPRRRESPDYRKSPDRRRKSPDHSQSARSNQRKNDIVDDKEKKGSGKNERVPQRNDRDKNKKEEKVSRENHEKEMPKARELEPPNLAISNKYAFLEPEED